MEIDINHCSDQHSWFKNSTMKVGNYTDYFVWKDAKAASGSDGKPVAPNNWVNLIKPCFFTERISNFIFFQKSVKNGEAWSFENTRKQFYFHQFEAKQPDLNLKNEALQFELRVSDSSWQKPPSRWAGVLWLKFELLA